MRTSFIATAMLAGLLAFSGAAQSQDWKTVRIGVEGAYPPFSYVTAGGEVKGFDIDIAKALCKAMQAKCSFVTQDWDGIIPALLARKYDAIIASMSITEERKKRVAFTNKYYNTPAMFARPKGSGHEISKESMKGKVVGVQRATIHDNFLTEEFGEQVEIRRYGTQDEAYLDAVAGRLDLLIADSVAMDEGFIRTEQGAGWEMFGPSYTEPRYFGDGAGIAIRKQDAALAEKFNRAIDTIRANGVYQRINKKYFDFDVYGG